MAVTCGETRTPPNPAYRPAGILHKHTTMTTKVTVKGQVTLPKAVRDAAGIKPGDRVNVRARPEGGVIVEREAAPAKANAYRDRLE